MATIVPTVALVGKQDGSTKRITWTPVTENDVCAPVSVPENADKSIQVLGTFGSAHIALHGSNDAGATFAVLHDSAGSAIDISAAGIKQILENVEQIKPITTSGTTSSVSIVVLARQSTPMRT